MEDLTKVDELSFSGRFSLKQRFDLDIKQRRDKRKALLTTGHISPLKNGIFYITSNLNCYRVDYPRYLEVNAFVI